MSFGIYCIKNKVNDKYYIGSTSTSFKQRWSTHKNKLNQNTHANEYLQRSWNKYGVDNFEFSIVEECDDKSDVLELELGMADSAEEAHKMYEECKNKSFDEVIEWKKQYTKQRKSKTLSKYHGITYVKSRNSPKKWYSVIVVDKVTVFQKYFLTELEAAIAYNNFIITNKLNKKLNEL